jgi:hypothetical protein
MPSEDTQVGTRPEIDLGPDRGAASFGNLSTGATFRVRPTSPLLHKVLSPISGTQTHWAVFMVNGQVASDIHGSTLVYPVSVRIVKD